MAQCDAVPQVDAIAGLGWQPAGRVVVSFRPRTAALHGRPAAHSAHWRNRLTPEQMDPPVTNRDAVLRDRSYQRERYGFRGWRGEL